MRRWTEKRQDQRRVTPRKWPLAYASGTRDTKTQDKLPNVVPSEKAKKGFGKLVYISLNHRLRS